MRLENIVIDAEDPQVLGAFWRDALGGETVSWTPDLVEVRLSFADSFVDVCLPRVGHVDHSGSRTHLDLNGGAEQASVVERLLTLGATRLDIGQGDVPWEVLADVEGNPFCVLDPRPEYATCGPIAAVPIDSVDPGRDVAFWEALTGWVRKDGAVPALQHPCGRGPRVEFCPEVARKVGKNHLHLDVRPEPGGDMGDAVAYALELGAFEVDHEWDVPWAILADPSGNEFCVLPPSTG